MNDLINRQEVIDIFQCDAEILRSVLYNMDVTGRDREKYLYGLELIKLYLEDIKELPPASQQTGQWIIHENADIIDGYYVPKFECSCCHTWKDDDSNFCPNCGMDMRERENKNNKYNPNSN